VPTAEERIVAIEQNIARNERRYQARRETQLVREQEERRSERVKRKADEAFEEELRGAREALDEAERRFFAAFPPKLRRLRFTDAPTTRAEVPTQEPLAKRQKAKRGKGRRLDMGK
jgi:hypothetical protein